MNFESICLSRKKLQLGFLRTAFDVFLQTKWQLKQHHIGKDKLQLSAKTNGFGSRCDRQKGLKH